MEVHIFFHNRKKSLKVTPFVVCSMEIAKHRLFHKRCIPSFHGSLTDIEVVPSLLHGDLWGGNAAQISGSPGMLLASTSKISSKHYILLFLIKSKYLMQGTFQPTNVATANNVSRMFIACKRSLGKVMFSQASGFPGWGGEGR